MSGNGYYGNHGISQANPGRKCARARPVVLLAVMFFCALALSVFTGKTIARADDTYNVITDTGDTFTWQTRAHAATSGDNTKHFRTIGWEFSVTSDGTTKRAVFYTGAGSHSKSDGISTSSTTSSGYTYTTVTLDKSYLESYGLGSGSSVSVVVNAIVEICRGDTVVYGPYNLRTELDDANDALEAEGYSGRFVTSGSGYTGYIGQGVTLTYYKVKVTAGTGIDTVTITVDDTEKGTSTSSVSVWADSNQTVKITYTLDDGYSFRRYEYGTTAAKRDSADSTRTTSSWSFSPSANRYIKVVGKANSYTVKFYRNGGSGGTDGTTQSFTYDVSQNLTSLSSLSFYRTGYTFAGWAKSKTGSVKYSDGESVSNLTTTANGSVDLYAKWTANTYTVTFHRNGGTGGTDGMTQSFTYDASKKKLTSLSSLGYKRTGYDFDGWATSANGKVVYEDEYEAKNLTTEAKGNIDLYAVWSACTYELTLMDGGSECGSYTMTYGSTSNNSLTKPTKEGYTFAGWKTLASGSCTEVYTSSGSYNSKATSYWNSSGQWVMTANTVLYAWWTAKTSTVTFISDGSTYATATATYDSTLSASVPSKTGYKFLGWYDSSDVKVFNADGTYNSASAASAYWKSGGKWKKYTNVTLYAKWEATTYQVRLYANKPVTERTASVVTAGSAVSGWSLSVDGTYYYKTMTYDQADTLPNPSSMFSLDGWEQPSISGFGSGVWFMEAGDGRYVKSDDYPVCEAGVSTVWNFSSDGSTVSIYARWDDVQDPGGGSQTFTVTASGGRTTLLGSDVRYKSIVWMEYGWEAGDVTLTFAATDNDAIQSFTLYKYSSYSDTESYASVKWDNVAKSYNTDGSAYSWQCTYKVSADTDEGITAYRAVVSDRKGNTAEIYVRVKIDVTAPSGETDLSWDGYILGADITGIVEDCGGDPDAASGCASAWVVVTSCDADGNDAYVDGSVYTQTVMLDLEGEETKTGAVYSGSQLLDDALVYDADYIKTVVHIKDVAGNERIICEEVFGSFWLEAYTERVKGEASAWRRGDAGYVNAATGAFVDSLEITFPSEWVEKNTNLSTEFYTYDYSGSQEEEKTERSQFIVPIYTRDGAHTVTVTAWKNGHSKSVEIPLETAGSVLEGLRTRLRVRN